MQHSVQITAANPALADLKPIWSTPVFTGEDGIGSLDSLHQAGDAFVAVARFDASGVTIVGSGVMVAPGLLLTATHVLDEFPADGGGPVFLTFLPEGARTWLPIDVTTLSGPSAFDEDRKVISDLSLVSCTLNSDARADAPFHLAPMKIGLPLIGDRLWAVGFRHQDVDQDGAARISPMISSGRVTGAFPHGRGERMASPCFEVAMETIGGMSGGAVVNEDGELVGIVSSSLEGGPSFMTLIWEALRMRVTGSIPHLARNGRVSLLGAQGQRLAKLKGDVDCNPWGEVSLRLSAPEANLMAASLPPDAFSDDDDRRGLSSDEREAFLEDQAAELEDLATEAAVNFLTRLPRERLSGFLSAAEVPAELHMGIEDWTVEDFEGLEDLTLISAREAPDGGIELEFFFEMQTYVWTFEISKAFHDAHAAALQDHFINVEVEGDGARMDLVQRAYFRGTVVFDPTTQTFGDIGLFSSAIHGPVQTRIAPAVLGRGA